MFVFGNKRVGAVLKNIIFWAILLFSATELLIITRNPTKYLISKQLSLAVFLDFRALEGCNFK